MAEKSAEMKLAEERKDEGTIAQLKRDEDPEGRDAQPPLPEDPKEDEEAKTHVSRTAAEEGKLAPVQEGGRGHP